MPTNDQVVSIHPYFKVSEGKLDEFRAFCHECLAITTQEPGCLYYGFSFADHHVHCREAYDNAEGLLTHLTNVGPILKRLLEISELTRLEIHGVASELAKLQEPLADLAPTYFTLEYGIRRS